MKIYERLKREHEVQKNLAKKLMGTSGASEERRRLFEEFKGEVEAHADAEEQTFYATLMESPDAQQRARHSVSEHKEAADVLKELSELDMGTGAWIQKFEKLKDELEHHIEEEEGKVFGVAKGVISDDLAEQLAHDFDERKSRELKQAR